MAPTMQAFFFSWNVPSAMAAVHIQERRQHDQTPALVAAFVRIETDTSKMQERRPVSPIAARACHRQRLLPAGFRRVLLSLALKNPFKKVDLLPTGNNPTCVSLLRKVLSMLRPRCNTPLLLDGDQM